MADGIMKHLLEDVVIDILLRIPVKFLFRFKCVSKSCYSFIQSSIFINLHLNRTTTAKDECILLKRSFKEDIRSYKTILSFLSGEGDDYLNPICQDLDVPTMTSSLSIEYDQLIGPCHGLIALMDSDKTVVLNPSSRKYRLLPPFPFSYPRGFYQSIKCVGFGYDSICNDYKVVRIIELHKEDHFRYPVEEEERVEVYDMSINSWRELHHVDLQFPVMHWLPCSQIFYEGVFHWVALEEILCFDISTEIFSSILIPGNHDDSSGPLYGLAILSNSLTLISYPYKVPSIDPKKDFTDIWIIKDYIPYNNWTKIFSIRGLTIGTPLAIWNDHHLFLFQSISGCLMSYHLNSSEVKEYIFNGCRQSMRVIVYVESMIAIPRGSENSAEDQNF